MRLFAEISYKGKHYHGWQKQPNAITIQSVTEKAFNVILRGAEFNCIGCGRTDTGVHAKQFYFHFETNEQLELDKFVYKVNTLLPEDIVVHRLIEVPEVSHARFDADSRTYKYYIHQKKNPFLTDISYYNSINNDFFYREVVHGFPVFFNKVLTLAVGPHQLPYTSMEVPVLFENG